ncbi:MAG: LacI family DNA-binding transcriptional regulator [Bacteroidetes bacterium]|nr:LacI family DNA-binding transcriptional regulator [Bacteroidota bacterium]
MIKLIDIAEKLNISLTTVSRALNDYSEVSPVTKELVKKTAKEMGYIPHRMAKNLALKKSHFISLLYDDYNESISYQSFTFEVIAGVRNFFGNTPYDLIIIPENNRNRKQESLKNMCYSRGVDGLFVVGIRTDDSFIKELKEDFLPAVAIDYPLSGKRISYIESDNIKGCKLAINYLVLKGHEHIAFINGHNLAAISQVRLDGYKIALKENGLPYNPGITIDSDYTKAGGYEAANILIKKNQHISAIFAASDLMAVGAIKALNEQGLKVPDDIAVIGFDDVFFAEHSQPGLTTVRQHKFEMGYQGAKLLHRIIEQPDYIPKRKQIDVELIIRDSA